MVIDEGFETCEWIVVYDLNLSNTSNSEENDECISGNFLGFGKVADIEIKLNGLETRKHVEVSKDYNEKNAVPVFYDGETISGQVIINVNKKKKLEHQGIKIEFIGLIDMYFDRASNYNFVTLEQDLARPGIITDSANLSFMFKDVEKPYETYGGINVNLKYMLKVTVIKRLTDMVKEIDILVHTLAIYPSVSDSLKMEVGIEECLHIEFEYNRSKYHLNDVIVGKIYFILVRVKIKYMELQIIKQEILGTGPAAYVENETITKYEIMDGAPVRGESIPIRLFLKGYDDLTPTMIDIGNRFSVKYYLNLVLVDEEDRRYFKQQGIFLYRKAHQKRTQFATNEMSTLMKQAVDMKFATPPSAYSQKHANDNYPTKAVNEE